METAHVFWNWTPLTYPTFNYHLASLARSWLEDCDCFQKNVKKAFVNIYSLLGHLSQKIRFLKFFTDVYLDQPCTVCGAARITRIVPQKKFKALATSCTKSSTLIFLKFLSIRWIDSNTLHCLLMTLQSALFLFFIERSLTSIVDLLVLFMMIALLLFLPFERTKGQNISAKLF